MHNSFLKTAVLLAALSIALGAFGAHGLKDILSAKSLATFETGVRYQFYHSLALLAAAMLYKEFNNHFTVWACRLFIVGVILFSGSLYLLAVLEPGFTFLGAITPFGGLAFIAGWVMLFISFSTRKH